MLGTILSWLIGFLTQWYVWVPIVILLGYITWRNYKRAEQLEAIDHVLLALEIPRANDKKELAAEQMFASLHGILRDKKELRLNGGMQEHISFEVAAIGKLIRFYVWVPKHLQNFVEGQIYAQYPTVQIRVADEDYTKRELQHPVVYTSELVLTSNEVLPIKTFQSFEVDPLAGITATLSKLESNDEEMWIQVLARPVADDWHRRSSRYVSHVKNSGSSGSGDFLTGFGGFLVRFFEALWKAPEAKTPAKELSERDRTRISEAEKKSTKLGYQVKIRLAYLGDDQHVAKLRMQALVGTFKQFNSTNLNGFRSAKASFKREDIAQYTARFFIDRGYILNIEELSSVFHLPHTNVETPNIVWASSKTAEPPAKLPIITGNDDIDRNISAFGMTNFRGINYQFGLNRYDRSRHIYIIGQTGAGKSGLLELFALSDIFHNHGYAIIDPHGDFATDNMRFIPASRIKDVVYFNPADTAYPLGFNPMEVHDQNMKSNTSSEIIGVLKRMFGDSWGPRLEYILRYTILALLDHPNTTMLDITRMLTDKKFRKKVLASSKDSVVLNFWNNEFASWTDKFASEAISPVLNKVGAFTANPIIRNIIGQPKSTFNIRQMMDEGKILIVNLSKGLIGEDNASILGSFLVTKVQLAAMSRSDIPRIEDRRPFYLYVDEFQNFATDSFATILSEARKYGLNLTVANQYVSQMAPTVRDAVFGNVGTMISFRVSPDDAPLLAKQFEPNFLPIDLLQMHNRHFVINMVINGEKAPAFSATTLKLPPIQTDNSAYIVENTRKLYGRPRAVVEEEIQSLVAASPNEPGEQKPQGQGSGNGQGQRPGQGGNYQQNGQRPKPNGPRPDRPQPQKLQNPQPSAQQQPQAQLQPATAADNNTLQPTQDVPPAPVDASGPAMQPQQQADTNANNGPAKKRRRSRNRSRGNGNGGGDSSNGGSTPRSVTIPPRTSSNETEIRLR
ncbi:MAG TPA: type IV secretion system DNA-binding domain-containing protein [Verrucomicrobiae bacterium]|nr:type IV secretion system DNA-binding domain-containing protein [Verrucomicrobiae bacterium]